MGSADLGNDYQVTMTVTVFPCDADPQSKPHCCYESQPDPPCPPGAYDDTYNSGCDAAVPPGPVLTLGFDSANGWIGRSGRWADPNNPNVVHRDYDWYAFTTTQNRRFQVYLLAEFDATWEIWNANDCAYGPIEGLNVPCAYDAGLWTVRCYAAGTHWLRIHPRGPTNCGEYYYLALVSATSCTPCNFNVSGAVDLDDPCDDLTDYDTNAGCDDPNAPPPHFMAFACGTTYQGRIYAGLQNGAPYYDPDWFTVTNTYTTNRKFVLTLSAEFQVHLELYTSCAAYDDGEVFGEAWALAGAGVVCPSATLTTLSQPPGTVLLGRITCVDQLHNLLTKYYPCAKGWNRWKVRAQCIL
jgi:hypothetical protein